MEKEAYQDTYDLEERNWLFVGTRKIMFNLLDSFYKKKCGRVLDAGCGTGINLKFLKKYGYVKGIDFSDEAVKYCKKRGFDIIKGSVEDMPFKNNSFDLVTSFDVIYHKGVKDDMKALKEFYRICKKGGLLLLKVGAFDFLYGDHDILVHTARRYTKKEIVNKVKKAGFTVKKASYIIMFFLPMVALIRTIERKSKNKKKINFSLKKNHPLVNRLLLFILNIEAFLVKFINLPVGVSIVCVAKKE